MAFTIQTVVADPTLVPGNIRPSAYVADPTLTLAYTRLLEPTVDASLVQGNIRLPVPVVQVVARLPLVTASGTAAQSTYSTVTLPGITATGTAVQAPAGLSEGVTLENITAFGAANSRLALYLPQIVATGTAVTGSTTSVNLPQRLPYPVAHGTTADTTVSSHALFGITASGTALSGKLGVSSRTFQGLQASGYGGASAVGTSQVSLPYVIARGSVAISSGASYSAVVLQTVMQGLSTYSNFPFNSLARFNGQVLAAGDSGLFKLEGDTDDGVQIDAAVRMGTTDFNSSIRTKVERVYIGYRSVGELILRVRTNGVTVRDYLVPTNGRSGIHGAHVRLGRGLEARYWQFEIRNRAGADFSLNMIEAKPTKTSRRVGGADA